MGKASRGNAAPQKYEAGAAGPSAEAQAQVGGVLLSSKFLEIPEWKKKSILMCLPGPRKILSGVEMSEPCLAPWRKISWFYENNRDIMLRQKALKAVWDKFLPVNINNFQAKQPFPDEVFQDFIHYYLKIHEQKCSPFAFMS